MEFRDFLFEGQNPTQFFLDLKIPPFLPQKKPNIEFPMEITTIESQIITNQTIKKIIWPKKTTNYRFKSIPRFHKFNLQRLLNFKWVNSRYLLFMLMKFMIFSHCFFNWQVMLFETLFYCNDDNRT